MINELNALRVMPRSSNAVGMCGAANGSDLPGSVGGVGSHGTPIGIAIPGSCRHRAPPKQCVVDTGRAVVRAFLQRL